MARLRIVGEGRSAVDGEGAGPARPSLRRRLGDLGRRHKLAAVGTLVICVFGLVALLAPWLDRYPPDQQHTAEETEENAPPSQRFWLGTDTLGRDQYSRLVHGARVSLAVGVLSQAIGVSIGVAVGLAAGMGGRWLDAVLMRLTDIAYAFPDLLLIILLVAVFGPSATMVVLAIGLASWMTIARLVRGQVLSLREEEFVVAARALGASDRRIAWRHLLPNLSGPVIVTATFGIPMAIFAEAALAYIGALEFDSLSWGQIIDASASLEALRLSPHLAITSCLAIAITMMSFTLIGDALRDELDPRTARRTRARAEPAVRAPARPPLRRAA
jgi:oligopeptide transport system permease protein